MKRCPRCKEELSSTCFSKNKKQHDGLNTYCKKCMTKYATDYRRNKRTGCSYKQYENMLHSQKGSCAICKTNVSDLSRALAVDHCHATGNIRELLCIKCNVGLGNFNDDIELMKKAIKYLRKHLSC